MFSGTPGLKPEDKYVDAVDRLLNLTSSATNPFKINSHVSPAWSACDVCYANFSFIGKMESRKRDLEELDAELGLGFADVTEHKTVSSRVASKRGDVEKALSTADIVETQMKRLPAEKREALCNYLLMDFLLFDYSSKWCPLVDEQRKKFQSLYSM